MSTERAGAGARWLYAALSAASSDGDVPSPIGVVDEQWLTSSALLPLLGGLESRTPGTLSRDLARRARTAFFAAELHSSRVITRFAGPAEALEAAGVRWAAIKGLDHLARFYPSPGWRPVSDVDLVVHGDDLALARAVFVKLGYGEVSGAVSPLSPGLTLERDGHYVDLHRRLFPAMAGGFAVDELVASSSVRELEGFPVRLMATDAAYAAHTLLLAKDLFLARATHPVRAAELAVLGDGAQFSPLAGARRASSRAHAVAAWARGGARPSWLAPDFGVPACYDATWAGRWEFVLRVAALHDTPWEGARFVGLTFAAKLARAASGGRLGRWDAFDPVGVAPEAAR